MISKTNYIDPAMNYRPVPFWSWNDKLDPEELRWQIREMHRQGLGGFFMHARGGLQTAYLSDDWMECVNACLDEAGKLGMEAWLYDENGWPSGFGGGLVNGLGEKYQQKYLRAEKKLLKDCGTQNTVAYYDAEGNFLSRTAPADAEAEVIRCYYEVNPYYVDNLDPEVVAEFIRVTHEFYYANIPANLLKAMKGIFTDEPQISRNGTPWSLVYEREYKKEYGRELIEELPFLFFAEKDYKEIRVRFWKLTAKLFNISFMKQIHDWCDAHGWMLTGHHVIEENLPYMVPSNGAMMPQYQYYHIPGMDVLSRINPNPIGMTQLLSSAMQFGHKQILTESFALTGWNFGFHGMKWMYQQQMAHGVNLLCQHLEGYSLRGKRKRDYPSSSFVHQPWWNEYKRVNDYFSRIGMLLAEGETQADLLVVHPLSSVWKLFAGSPLSEVMDNYTLHLRAVSEALDAVQIPHHYADDVICDEYSSFEDGKIRIGKCTYNTVLIPKVTNMSAKIAELVRKLHQAGGKVYVIENDLEDVSFTIDGREAAAEYLSWLASLPTFATEKDAASAIAENMSEIVRITENGAAETDILSTYRDIEIDGRKGRFYFFTNRRYTEFSKVEISLPAVGSTVEVMDHESGEFSVLDGVKNVGGRLVFDYPFASGEGLAIFVSDKAANPEKVYTAIDFSVMPAVKKLADDFEVVCASDGNIITLDRCRYRVDGGEWIFDDVCVIHERLLKRKCDCDLEMEFDFEVTDKFDLSTPLTLISETPAMFEYFLNNQKVENVDGGKFFDQAFRRIALSGNLKSGVNTITLKCRYHQDQNVYASLEKAKKFETEYNKLTFDSEIESIYLVGNFRVEHIGSVEQLDRQAKRYCGKFVLGAPLVNSTLNAADIAEDGMTFFAGKTVLKQNFDLTADEAAECKYLRFRHIGANSYRIRINGTEAGFLYDGQFVLPAGDLLKEGENTLEIEMTVSLRNMLGPHHNNEGESYSVATTSWLKEPNAVDKKNMPYNENYCMVEIGLSDIELI